jgi:hypothetical protein
MDLLADSHRLNDRHASQLLWLDVDLPSVREARAEPEQLTVGREHVVILDVLAAPGESLGQHGVELVGPWHALAEARDCE